MNILAPIIIGLIALLPLDGFAEQCVAKYSTKELCVLPSADMSRIYKSPEVLEAAKVVALKLKPYLPDGVNKVNLIMGYRSEAQQERIRDTGVRAGPSSGKFESAHIYGVAVDIEVRSNKNLGKEMCAALNQILPMLKNKGGVIMEGSGGGSTNGHIDDNWGARFAMEKTGVQKSLNYTGDECTEDYGVTGPSAEKFRNMAKITAKSLNGPSFKSASMESDDTVDESDPNASSAAKAAGPDTGRKPASWTKYH